MGRKKLLLVDDSETAIMMEKMFLRGLPCDLVVARNGKDALAKAETEKPDLILMDVNMPLMGGFDVCKELRQREATKTTPIILVTTMGNQEQRQIGAQAGCTEYVTKPINGPDLVAKVKALLGI